MRSGIIKSNDMLLTTTTTTTTASSSVPVLAAAATTAKPLSRSELEDRALCSHLPGFLEDRDLPATYGSGRVIVDAYPKPWLQATPAGGFATGGVALHAPGGVGAALFNAVYPGQPTYMQTTHPYMFATPYPQHLLGAASIGLQINTGAGY
jgi:hypothetical protein